MTGRRYESAEPGTRRWLDAHGFKGYGTVFAASVWARMQLDRVDVGSAVEAERAARLSKIEVLAPADPFEGL
jgi:hypothetical protein